MKIDRVLIFSPSFEQRVSKQAYSFLVRDISTIVYAEEASVSKEFENYIVGVSYKQIPVNEKLKRTPIGIKRKKFLRNELEQILSQGGNTIIISRDVNYGFIIGKILKSINGKQKFNYTYITDIADNYDLFYASFRNIVKKTVFKYGFHYITKYSLKWSDALYIVAEINRNRLKKHFNEQIEDKPIYLLRNLPMKIKYIRNLNKIPNSLVYLGKIDEISRDPFYVLQQMKNLPEFSLHFYSEQKKETIEKMKKYINENGIQDRVIFHKRVKYDELAEEISNYQIGLVPHKRGPITDYTTPNKIYDYKISGVVTVMSDCPSLEKENNEFGFGVIYSKEDNTFVSAINKALVYQLNFDINMPCWDEEFEKSYNSIIKDV